MQPGHPCLIFHLLDFQNIKDNNNFVELCIIIHVATIITHKHITLLRQPFKNAYVRQTLFINTGHILNVLITAFT